MTTREEIYLGALLHDIGKFWQRASGLLNDNDSNLSNEAKNIADYICPTNQKGFFGYQHVLWTYQFYLEHKDIFNNISETKNIFEIENQNIDNFINFSIYHHKPNSLAQALIQLADWWASGTDRSNDYEYANRDMNWGKEKYKKVPLSAILQNIYVNNQKPNKEKEWHFDLNPLSLDKDVCFPKELSGEIKSLQTEYKNLWDKFVIEFKQLPTKNFNVFVESLYYLLKKYTWCIPASTQDYPDSSLFEHSKMVAAFADCLFSYYEENPDAFEYKEDKFRLKLRNGFYPVIMLCADISGIQKFIYDITNKKASKSLRGRSFYLQILIETIVNQLLEKTQRWHSHVVYSSGGKMFMLLPNTEAIRKTIEDYRNTVEKFVWNNFQGSIYVSIDFVAFAYDMDAKNRKNILIEGKNGYHYLGDLWKAVVDKTAAWKTKKFKSLILNDPNFFEPFGQGGEIKVCAITGLEADKFETLEKENENEETIVVSPQVFTHIKIGENLIEHKYLIYSSKSQPKHLKEYCKYNFNILNSDWYLYDDNIDKLTSLENTIVYSISDDNVNFLQTNKGDKNKRDKNVYGFRFYGGNKVPTISHQIKTFEELVDKEANFKRLAILRMDVDNLSQLFINGFKEINENQIITDNSNFSKLATLSFQLDVFFSGYLNVIHRKYLDDIIIIYSGGDDLFAVGDWQAIIDFAEDIRNEFRNYVCNREDISLSAGIVLIDEKFPISKGAEMAGEAEKQAKNFKNSAGKTKNAINLFGENICWDNEYQFVKDMTNYLVWALNDQKISKGLLQKIFSFREMKRKNLLSWQWLSAYTFARHTTDKNREVMDDFKKLFITNSIELNGNYYRLGGRTIELLVVAARWAELKLRSEN